MTYFCVEGVFTMKRERVSFLLIAALLIILGLTGTALAESTLVMVTDKTELGPQEQVRVLVQAMDENQIPVAGEMKVLLRISRGGLLEPKILKEGLTVVDGVAEFTYIAPTKPGNADILLIDPGTNLSARLNLKVTEEPVQAIWKKEFARITKIKGRVAYKSAGQETWNSALSNIELQEGDSIRTWEKSRVTLELFDGSEITLEPWTTLYIKFLQSSLANAEIKQSIFKIYTGNVLCKVQKYVEKGSRFEIETESTAAGIRGTVFELISTIEGHTELIVYEGSVVIESLPQEILFVVDGGQRVVLPAEFEVPDVIEHTVTAEEREQALYEEQNVEEGEMTEEESSETEPVSEEPVVADPITMPDPGETPFTEITDVEPTVPTPNPSGSFWQSLLPDRTSLNFGSQKSVDRLYFVFNLQPDFMNILGSGLSIGLNLALYQDPDTGVVRIGSPDENVKISNFINWLEYDGKYTYLRYGNLENITYGYGMLLANYSKKGARGIQVGFDNLTSARFGSRVLLPLDITSFHPWTMEETSSLYAARLTSKVRLLLLPFQAGATIVTDTNSSLHLLPYAVPNTGVGLDVSMPGLSLLEPYMEMAYLNNFGYGAELGVRGKVFSNFWYQTGFRAMSESFIPNYFGNDYEEYKKNSLLAIAAPSDVTGRILPDLYNAGTYAATSGAYFQAGANLGLASLKLSYENYSGREAYAPILSADFIAQSPEIFHLPRLSCGFNYRQLQFARYHDGLDPFFNKNTIFSWYVSLPISSDLSLSFVSRFIPSDTEINFTRELNINVPF